VVVLGGNGIERLADAAEVDRLAADRERVALDQVVPEVQLAQVPLVHREGHARGVHVPVEHVEGRRRLAVEVAVHDVVPDQAVGAQQAEGRGHLLAVEVALALHRLGQPAHAALVDEDLDVARLVEIHQGGEQRPVRDRHLVGSPYLRLAQAIQVDSAVPPMQ
jgi:hypothetical protein